MDSKGRRYQVDERRFVADLSIAEEFGPRDMATAPVGLNALPIVNSHQDMLARLRRFNSGTTSRPSRLSARRSTGPTPKRRPGGPKCVQRRDYQAEVETRDAPQQRFEPGFCGISVGACDGRKLGPFGAPAIRSKISPFVLRVFVQQSAAGSRRKP